MSTEDDDSEAEDFRISPDDAVVVVAKTEEVSFEPLSCTFPVVQHIAPCVKVESMNQSICNILI